MGREPTAPITTFLRSSTIKPITVEAAKVEKLLNIGTLKVRVAELHPIVRNTVEKNQNIGRKKASSGTLPNFTEGTSYLLPGKTSSLAKNLPSDGADGDACGAQLMTTST